MARPGRWIPPGEMVEVQDYILRGGMLYVGTGMKDPAGTPEPSLINPLCPVQATYGCYSTKTLDYWPNYSVIAAETRGAYLGWLASGRSHPQADVGFVFMYFYGLERRAFIDAYADAAAQAEWPVLLEEVRRLLTIYGHHKPFAERANKFIDMLVAAKTAKNLVFAQGKYASSLNAMPLDLKKELGLLALAGTPMSSDKAIAWALTDPSLKRGAVISRHPKSFPKLFAHIYDESYPGGMLLPIVKTKLLMSYEPASQSVAGFGEIGLYLDEIPDVTLEGGVTERLQELLNRCNDALAPYSRFVSRNAHLAESLEAQVLLPDVLWPEALKSAIAQWRERVGQSAIVTCPNEIAASFGSTATTGKELLPLLRVLSVAQVGIEPELSGKLPKGDEPLALFYLDTPEESLAVSPAYLAARVTLQLAQLVALEKASSGIDAMDFIVGQIEGWVHLSRGHRARLVAYAHYLRAAPVTLSTAKKNSSVLEPVARAAIARFLCRVAQLGQDATPIVVKALSKLYKALELDVTRLHSDLHSAVSGRASGPEVKGAAPVLDAARIAALQEDTAVVGALLADIFVEDEPVAVTTIAVPGPSIVSTSQADTSAALWGLDAAHSEFVLTMRTRASWSRDELLAHATSLGLMLDGALERINEAAYDALDMPFTEGEDPFEINLDLPEDLTT
jgi:hypothetical protein